MKKRQRKKFAKKRASNPCLALIESTRAILRRDTLMSEVLVNDAWRKLQDYLRWCQESELEHIERGPMQWIGITRDTEYLRVLKDRFSKASGTHAAAGKDELK